MADENTATAAAPDPGAAAGAPSPAPAPLRDKFGTDFRRGFHRENPDGSPFLGTRGQYMPRGGRKPKNLVPPRSEPPPPPEAAPRFDDIENAIRGPVDGPLAPLSSDEYTQAAAGVVAGLSTAAILAMGAHVAPTTEQTLAMVRAYADSFRAYGYKPQMPPWLPPTIATATWIGPHFANPKSQEKLAGWRSKFVNLWLWLKSKTASRAAASAAADATRAAHP